MKYAESLTAHDNALSAALKDFVPSEIFDIHAHLINQAHFAPNAFRFLEQQRELGAEAYRAALMRYMPVQTIHSLHFGLPHKTAVRAIHNAWMTDQAAHHSTPLSHSLLLVSPQDDPNQVAQELRSGRFCGLKVYHCYASRPDTMNASITEFAPDWMWELLHEVRGVMMLHLVKDAGIADPDNQREIRRLSRAYPNMRLVLAHIARSFNYRNARASLRVVADLDNVVVDTSAICESEPFRCALEFLGPQRILWGSDFPVSEARGRCVTTGSSFFWLYADELPPPVPPEMTLIGLESLCSLREACEDAGLTRPDIQDIFLRNALRLLSPCRRRSREAGEALISVGTRATASQHSPEEVGDAVERVPTSLPIDPPIHESNNPGPPLWQRARKFISGGTGLLSKRAESFDAETWPAYFSRCSGCEVWDLAGRRYLDFAGGIGGVFLGYADPDANAAVRRRLSHGSYCTLVSPQEVELAQQLLSLHPWAGKARYARGGGDAMAVAIRTARAATGRSGIAFCGYHGWHDWYLAANLGKSDALDGHLLPGLDPRGVPRELSGTSIPFRYNDLASLDAALARLDGNLAAVVMEPMRSQFPTDDFVAKAAARCRAAGAVFVVDEVTSGLRFGFPGALSRLKIEPDMAVYAKAMSNGFPFGIILGRDEIMKAAESSFISSSYWTDGIGPAACLAVLEKVQRLRVHELVWTRGEEFQKSLRQLAAAHTTCRLVISGMPSTPTLTFDLGPDASIAKTLYIRKMRERGFLATTVFFLMFAHEPHHVAMLVENLDRVLGELGQVIASGRLAEEVGRPFRGESFARLA